MKWQSVDSQFSVFLQRWVQGDRQALDEIIPVVYDRLRQIAHQRRWNAPGDASLNTTELVHEAFLNLVDAPMVDLRDRSHFLALASQVMRNLLVDHARARQAVKRGGGQSPVALDPDLWISDDKAETITELDDALKRLESMDERQGRILELRYFGGLSLEETAEALEVSLATVKRDLRSARAWLAMEFSREPSL